MTTFRQWMTDFLEGEPTSIMRHLRYGVITKGASDFSWFARFVLELPANSSQRPTPTGRAPRVAGTLVLMLDHAFAHLVPRLERVEGERREEVRCRRSASNMCAPSRF
jgi:hypothetical protein